jgi:hypothetical protein
MPMYPIFAASNMAHYRNSADYEEAVYHAWAADAWFSGLTEQWVSDVLNGAIQLGSRAAHSSACPSTRSAGLLQPTLPNTLAKEAMDQKEAQMLALGAKLVEGSQVRTHRYRSGYRQHFRNVDPIVASRNGNVAKAFTWRFALSVAARFVGAADTGMRIQPEYRVRPCEAYAARASTAYWPNGKAGRSTFEEYARQPSSRRYCDHDGRPGEDEDRGRRSGAYGGGRRTCRRP